MRGDYRDWLKAEGYSDKTISTQMSEAARIEASYGPIEDILSNGGYDALFAELTYSSEDERRNRPNPSKLRIDGNLRNNLASYKNALARHARFLGAAPGATPGAAVEPSVQPPADSLEKQRLSLERDMQTALREDLARLEPGLVIIDDGAVRAVTSGFIDILARDAAGAVVVIELKARKTDARVVGQVLGYMGDIAAEDEPDAVRGIIVAHEFDLRTRSAARAVPNPRLVRYAVSCSFAPEV